MGRGVMRCERLVPSLLLVDLSLKHVDVALAVSLKAVHTFGKCKELLYATRRTTSSLNFMQYGAHVLL
jgi:hypothetical protein